MTARAASRSSTMLSMRRTGPSGRVAWSPSLPRSSATSSRLPPPRSPIRPSASGMPDEHALGGQPRLLLAGDHAHAHAAAALDLGDELGAVLGVAHRRGRQQVEALHRHRARQPHEAGEIVERQLDAGLVQPARRIEAAAEAAQHLLVEQRDRRPATAARRRPAGSSSSRYRRRRRGPPPRVSPSSCVSQPSPPRRQDLRTQVRRLLRPLERAAAAGQARDWS